MKPEVLFISHKHPPSIGGIQIQNRELVDGVARHLKVHRLIYDNRSSRLAFFSTAAIRARRLLERQRSISVIHLSDGFMAACVLPLCRATKVPLVATVHGLDVAVPSGLYQRRVVQRFNELAAVVPVSRGTAAVCLDRNIRPEKLHVIPNGVDPALGEVARDPEFWQRLEARLGRSLHQRRILLNVGRAVRRKGLSWFVREVMPRLPDDVVFLMVGPRFPELKWLFKGLAWQPWGLANQVTRLLGLPEDEPDILEAIRQAGLQERAFELGRLSLGEMVQLFKAADLFVMPNVPVEGDVEGFGLVVLEAAACGLPVLASDIEGLTDAVVHGRNGWLVPARDPRAWAEQIRLALGDRRALRRFGRASQAYTRSHCSWSRMVDRYLVLFERLSLSGTGGEATRPSKALQLSR